MHDYKFPKPKIFDIALFCVAIAVIEYVSGMRTAIPRDYFYDLKLKDKEWICFIFIIAFFCLGFFSSGFSGIYESQSHKRFMKQLRRNAEGQHAKGIRIAFKWIKCFWPTKLLKWFMKKLFVVAIELHIKWKLYAARLKARCYEMGAKLTVTVK